MRFAVVGAGAIGGFAGAMLSRAGEDVSLIARGAHLRAIQERGIRIHGQVGDFVATPFATDDPSAVGPVDVILLAVKAHSVAGIAPRLGPLLNTAGKGASIITMQNGIPWWFFQGYGGDLDGYHLESVDPGGLIASHIDSTSVIGCAVYVSSEITEPGVIEHVAGERFSIGEPDGSKSERCRAISEAFIRAGLRCPVRTDIRHEIWVKVMGNMAFNPISALTRATLVEIAQCPETRRVVAGVMHESEQVAKRLGIEIGISIDQRIQGAERVGHHKTSMLQDLEARRPMEIEPVVGAVVELGKKLEIPMPYTESVYSCVKLLGQHMASGA